MQMINFPRPPEDNGRGVHWSSLVHHPTGRDLEFWLNELSAMHMKWVRLLDDGDGSSLELCRRLLSAGIMPVVRLYREQPNPGRIGSRAVSGVRKLVAAGVRYFETNDEPDLPAQWQDNQKPPNWLDVVADHFIYDADVIIDEGGLPAVPAMGPGGRDNLIKRVADRGRDDLFQKGVWLAIHNFTLNHPLDYPDDPVNQDGQPLTREEFERLPAWAWDHRSMQLINERRARDKNPGQTLAQDANCFRAWEWAGRMVHDVLGYHIPIISTAGGPVVGSGDDLRYPKVTPDQQRDWQVDIARFMQEGAPAWYFACCTWLLASRPLGDWDPTREQMSWYTDAWNERFGLAGQLPVVQALKDLPPQTRPELRQGIATLAITLLRADRNQTLPDVTVEVESGGDSGAPIRRFRAKTDTQGKLTLDRLPAADYRLLVYNAEAGRISLSGGERKTSTLKVEAGRRSQVSGQIVDTNGLPQPDLVVTLHQVSPPRLLAETRTDRNGRYRFPGLPVGKVIVRVAPGTEQSSERRNVVLDGWSETQVDLRVPPVAKLRYAVVKKRLLTPAQTGNDNFIFGRVLDETGNALDNVTVRLRWTGAGPETQFPTVKSGQNPFRPRGYFEFIHTPGVFMVDILDGEFESQVADNLVTADMPGHSRPISYEVIFQRKPSARPTHQSSIQGRVLGGLPHLTVTLSGSGIEPRLLRLDAGGFFHFGELPAGIYQVGLEGVGIIFTDVTLDGVNSMILEFPMLGQIVGRVLPPDQPATVILTCEQYSIRQEDDTDAEGEYVFANLPGDTYTLRLKGSSPAAQQVICDGRHVVDGPTFDREFSEQSQIAGRITDHRGAAVANTILWLRSRGQRVAEGQTDANGHYRFEKLGAGTYGLELIGVGLIAQHIDVDGANQVNQDVELAPPAHSQISGRLLDHEDQPVASRTLLLSGPTSRQATTTATGAFRFEGLAVGDYVVRVADVPSVKSHVSLGAEDHREVTLRLPASASASKTPLGHYLFLTSRDAETATSQITLLLDYILRKTPTIGFRPEGCTRAAQVTIVGVPEPSLLQQLREKDIPFHQVTGNLENLRAEVEALP